MERLPLSDDDFSRYLPNAPRKFLKERDLYFFKIRYTNDEIIMPRGNYSDFAGVHLQGVVKVYEPDWSLSARLDHPEQCWNRPGWLRHRLEAWVLDRTDRLDQLSEAGPWLRWLRPIELRLAGWLRVRLPVLVRRSFERRWHEQRLGVPIVLGSADPSPEQKPIAVVTTRGADGQELPVIERFMGVTSALWNLPRSVTLVAAPDGKNRPCEFLLVKRDVLEALAAASPAFLERVTGKFFNEQLPRLMSENRLFRDTFYLADILDWPRFRDLLCGTGSSRSAALERIRRRLDARILAELAGSEDSADPSRAERIIYRTLSALNELLKRPDLDDPAAWGGVLGAEVEALRKARAQEPLSQNETIRLNRLLVESAFGPEVLRPSEGCGPPRRVADFEQLLKPLDQRGPEGGIALVHVPKDQEIVRQGEHSQALRLIVGGKVRVTRTAVGGTILVNQLERHGYLEVSFIEPGATHSATATAYTDVRLVVFTGAALEALVSRPFLRRKLQNERARLAMRDRLDESIHRLPPPDPPEEIVSKLLAATDLLRIDMDLCTRCDQCVAGCREAHDGVARFHRANPSLRFGKWEIARACVHCSDAPCQTACPVGAITFLDDGIVQLHRSRCIGCEACVPACPFDAIEMTPPRFQEFPYQSEALFDMAPNNNKGVIANKCDLCLTVHRDPPCVASCPYGAATRGAPRVLFPDIKSRAESLSVR
jgi:Fe-S-cluster-containing hydrogenase component 2